MSGLCSRCLSHICLITMSLISMLVICLYPTSYMFSLSCELPHPTIRILSEVLTYLWRTSHSSGYSPYLQVQANLKKYGFDLALHYNIFTCSYIYSTLISFFLCNEALLKRNLQYVMEHTRSHVTNDLVSRQI